MTTIYLAFLGLYAAVMLAAAVVCRVQCRKAERRMK